MSDQYRTENLTAMSGGGAIVSYQLLTDIVEEIANQMIEEVCFIPALKKLQSEWIDIQTQLKKRET